jgi:hypothetical protein
MTRLSYILRKRVDYLSSLVRKSERRPAVVDSPERFGAVRSPPLDASRSAGEAGTEKGDIWSEPLGSLVKPGVWCRGEGVGFRAWGVGVRAQGVGCRV